MHVTAMANAEQFFNTYVHNNDSKKNLKIVEIGSQDINGGIRQLAPKDSEFVGLDFQVGSGVNLLLSDPYVFPLEDENCDVVLSSSCFEHSEFFWLTFLEALRILKPHGLLYINAPSNGSFHRYPVDCWRFYPDSGVALCKWARLNGIDAELLESYVSYQQQPEPWNDFVGVFVKERKHADLYPKRITDSHTKFMNGVTNKSDEILKHSRRTQDQKRLGVMREMLANKT